MSEQRKAGRVGGLVGFTAGCAGTVWAVNRLGSAWFVLLFPAFLVVGFLVGAGIQYVLTKLIGGSGAE